MLLQSSGNPISLIFLLAMMGVMYFFFIRPQVKKQKSQDEFTKGLQKGDEIVTGSGLIGKITKIEPNRIQLQLDQKVFISVIPGAISNEMTAAYNKSKTEKA